jgi:hypothetical protein
VFTPEDVERAVATAYPPDDRAEVLALLGGYAHGASFPAPEVQMAVLALAQVGPPGDRVAAVAAGVRLANLDPRDVLAAAYWPDQVRAPHTRADVREAYRRLGVARPPV